MASRGKTSACSLEKIVSAKLTTEANFIHGEIAPWMKLASVVSFVLTIFSKEQAMVFPLLAMIYEHFFRDDRAQTSFWQKVRRYGEFWLMDVAYVLFRIEHL